MMKVSKWTDEQWIEWHFENRLRNLKMAQWWLDQSEWCLTYTNSIDALRDFIRGLRALAWGLGSRDKLEIVE